MPRKPKNTDTTSENTSNETATMDDAPQAASTAATKRTRPGWVDGAPVDAEGQFVREGSPRPSRQMEVANSPDDQVPAAGSGESDLAAKNWGEPYKSVFGCPEMGFELGEHRRFKQRVFRFADKPTAEILEELKELGFIYRAAEKSWTIPATPDSRKLTDDLARKWAGPNYIRSVER